MATTPTDDPLANSDRTVGVRMDQDLKSLKRDALLFDQIAIPHLDDLDVEESKFAGSSILPWGDASFWKELRWLRDSGIVRDVPPIRDDATASRQYLDAIAAQTGKPIDVTAIPDEQLRDEVLIRISQGISEDLVETLGPRGYIAVLSRIHSIGLRLEGINAFPILETRRQIGDVFPSGTTPDTTPVLEVVLKSMPMPDDQTAWQDIIEFRNDPESMKRLRKLRVWVRKFAKATIATSLAQMKEEIEVLLEEYEEHMKLHRMKVNKGATETLLTVAGKLAEDFVKLKLGELAKLPFILQERKISLAEAELKAPNRELAFISMARSRFSR